MSVYLYRREFTDEMPPMESSDALILGIIAGIIGALVTTILSTMISLILGPVEIEMVRNFVEKFGEKLENSGSLPPGTMDDLREKLEVAMKESGKIGGILRSLVYALILYPIFSMLGGLIGYGIFGKKKPTIPPLPPMQQ